MQDYYRLQLSDENVVALRDGQNNGHQNTANQGSNNNLKFTGASEGLIGNNSLQQKNECYNYEPTSSGDNDSNSLLSSSKNCDKNCGGGVGGEIQPSMQVSMATSDDDEEDVGEEIEEGANANDTDEKYAYSGKNNQYQYKNTTALKNKSDDCQKLLQKSERNHLQQKDGGQFLETKFRAHKRKVAQ